MRFKTLALLVSLFIATNAWCGGRSPLLLMDADGDNVSTQGDQTIITWWIFYGGDIALLQQNIPPLNAHGLYDLSGFFASEFAQLPPGTGPATTATGFPMSATSCYGNPCLFRRGDANRDCSVNIADATYVFNYLFSGGAAPQNMDAADANDDGTVSLGDGVTILNWGFGSATIPPPFQAAGYDVTDDDLEEPCYVETRNAWIAARDAVLVQHGYTAPFIGVFTYDEDIDGDTFADLVTVDDVSGSLVRYLLDIDGPPVFVPVSAVPGGPFEHTTRANLQGFDDPSWIAASPSSTVISLYDVASLDPAGASQPTFSLSTQVPIIGIHIATQSVEPAEIVALHDYAVTIFTYEVASGSYTSAFYPFPDDPNTGQPFIDPGTGLPITLADIGLIMTGASIVATLPGGLGQFGIDLQSSTGWQSAVTVEGTDIISELDHCGLNPQCCCPVTTTLDFLQFPEGPKLSVLSSGFIYLQNCRFFASNTFTLVGASCVQEMGFAQLLVHNQTTYQTEGVAGPFVGLCRCINESFIPSGQHWDTDTNCPFYSSAIATAGQNVRTMTDIPGLIMSPNQPIVGSIYGLSFEDYMTSRISDDFYTHHCFAWWTTVEWKRQSVLYHVGGDHAVQIAGIGYLSYKAYVLDQDAIDLEPHGDCPLLLADCSNTSVNDAIDFPEDPCVCDD